MKKLLLGSLLIISSTVFADFEVQTIGAAAKYNNKIYKADGEYVPVPLINLNYNRFFIKGLKPGFVLYNEPSFKFSIIADPLGGYFDGWTIKSSDMDRGYENIDDRDSQFMYGLDVDFDFSENILGNINYLLGSEGSKGEAYLTYVQYLTDRIVILPSVSVKYFNKDFVDYYVGVSNNEVLKNSKIDKKYDGGDSFSLGMSITMEMAMTDQFIMSFFIGYDYFDDKITDSPIVDKDNQIYGGIGFRYSF